MLLLVVACRGAALAPAPCVSEVAQLMGRWNRAAPPAPLEKTLGAHELSATDERRLAQVAARTFPDLGSKSQAVAALKRGDLALNGELHAEGCRRVVEGDTLLLQQKAPAALSPRRFEARCRFVSHLCEQGLRAVHEDDDCAVVFKPAGVHTKAAQNPKYGALEDALPAVLSPPEAASDALPLPLAMHRLDVRVSGLLLVAKTRRAALSLARQFEGRSVLKEYEALLVGAPPDEMTICTPIEVDGALLASRTTLVTLLRQPHPQWGVLSHVRLSPHTGRTHQLRVHAASLGSPIVGDDLYWAAASAAREEREERGVPPLPAVRKGGGLFLQSCAVEFDHPAGSAAADPGATAATAQNGRVRVEVAAEPKFAALLERARKGDEFSESQQRVGTGEELDEEESC